jgi:hypothetical protein
VFLPDHGSHCRRHWHPQGRCGNWRDTSTTVVPPVPGLPDGRGKLPISMSTGSRHRPDLGTLGSVGRYTGANTRMAVVTAPSASTANELIRLAVGVPGGYGRILLVPLPAQCFARNTSASSKRVRPKHRGAVFGVVTARTCKRWAVAHPGARFCETHRGDDTVCFEGDNRVGTQSLRGHAGSCLRAG